jgi:hypothetical protein
MADTNKKAAAVLAAVSAYIQQEEDAARLQFAVPAEPSGPCMAEFSQWSHSGRQEMMAMRRLIQLRIFDRLR